DSKLAKNKSKEIDNQLKLEGKRNSEEVLTLLLLGPADSGKSTVLRQMVLIHRNGFSPNEIQEAKEWILNVTLKTIQQVLMCCMAYQVDWDNLQDTVTEIVQYHNEDTIPSKILENCRVLGSNATFQDAAHQLVETGAHETESFYLNHIDRICQDSFSPTDEDMLRMRKPTQKMTENMFRVDSKPWRVIDVAGQHDKRQKWTSFLDRSVTSIIYVFSCAAFDQFVVERPDLNRIEDALELFHSLVQNPALKIKSVIVFMNKFDLLQKKMERVSVKDMIKRYKGKCDNSINQYLGWLKSEFLAMAKGNDLILYTHETTAIDVHIMRKTLHAVKENIMQTLAGQQTFY
ncbi:guanine nucleotide binding protein, alpha subunit, partial [Gorgonomyces haynaldii]